MTIRPYQFLHKLDTIDMEVQVHIYVWGVCVCDVDQVG